MVIVCPNCGYHIKLSSSLIHYINECPKCGTFLSNDGVGCYK